MSDLLTTSEVMARLRVSRQTVGRMVADKRLTKIVVAAYSGPRYDSTEVEKLLEPTGGKN